MAPDEVTVIEAEVESWLEPVLDVSLAAGDMTHVEAQSTLSADHGQAVLKTTRSGRVAKPAARYQ